MVNMGVEDEWGKAVPPERMLNNKEPLNFILEEPTLLKFIDPTMALHNAGMQVLFNDCGDEKFILPSEKLNEYYLNIVRRDGIINRELDMLEKYNCKGWKNE